VVVVHAASVADFCPVLVLANAMEVLSVVLQFVAVTSAQVTSVLDVHAFVPIACA
jgi:hypothetical protein